MLSLQCKAVSLSFNKGATVGGASPWGMQGSVGCLVVVVSDSFLGIVDSLLIGELLPV